MRSRRRLLALSSLLLAGCATPMGMDRTPIGGASDKRLAEFDFLISVGLNGYSPAADLKPQVLERARQIAREHGFTDFQILRAAIRSIPGFGHNAETLVRFSKDQFAPIPGIRYPAEPDDADRYRSSIDLAQTSQWARVTSSKLRDGDAILVEMAPAFIDAIHAHMSMTDDNYYAYVRPGTHRFLVAVMYKPGWMAQRQYRVVEVAAALRESRRYSFGWQRSASTLTYWVEDEGSKERVSPAGSIDFAR